MTINIIEPQVANIAALCRQFGVRRLEVFGSAAGSAFDSEHSDIDFLVDFDPEGKPDLFHRYFGLNEALARLFERKVDLVMVGAMRNRYFIESVAETRKLVYAAPVAQTA